MPAILSCVSGYLLLTILNASIAVKIPLYFSILERNKNFLIPSAKQALKKLNVKIIEVDFEEKWEQKVIQELKKII